MHYSHFKTHSLQHLKPIKCEKRVCKYKTPTCFVLFPRPSSGGPTLCFVPLLFLPLICVRLVLYYYTVCGRMCMSSVHVWCSCLLVICLCLWVYLYRSPTDKNTKHTQMTYTCGHILRNNTKPNERKSA